MGVSREYKLISADRALICGIAVIVKKRAYDWLWVCQYEDGTVYAGPYKTRKEAREKLAVFGRVQS